MGLWRRTLRLTKSIVNLRAFFALAFSDLDPEPTLWRVLLLRHNRPAGHARPLPFINSLYQLYGARSFTIAVASARYLVVSRYLPVGVIAGMERAL
jgi:hypothetical protein